MAKMDIPARCYTDTRELGHKNRLTIEHHCSPPEKRHDCNLLAEVIPCLCQSVWRGFRNIQWESVGKNCSKWWVT